VDAPLAVMAGGAFLLPGVAMVQHVKRIGIVQQGKLMGALYFLLGIVAAVCMWAVTAAMPSLAMSRGFGMGMGVGFLVIAPLIYGVIGFLAGMLVAWLYNICASVVGGMELELE